MFRVCFVLLPALLAGAGSDEDVVFRCDFEAEDWRKSWGEVGHRDNLEIVTSDPTLKFKPLRGRAVRVRIRKDGHYGGSLVCRFKKQSGTEPEEIYFRYYLRFADDWDPKRGGKLPGVAGTYGRAGWGGRRVDGKNGWSARGLFKGREEGKTPVGYYCYHVDQKSRYGDNFLWKPSLENNRWYCLEQYVKLNTPGKHDGVLRGWIDGKIAFEKTDVRFRDVASLKIETVWMNFYHGGKWSSPTDDHVYIDEVVISRKRIGMLK